MQHVWQLPRLRQLVLDSQRMTASWRQLAALTGLEHLDVSPVGQTAHKEIVEALSALAALTLLEMGCIEGVSLSLAEPVWPEAAATPAVGGS